MIDRSSFVSIVLGCLLLVSVIFPFKTSAQIGLGSIPGLGSLGLPFGGFVVASIPCTCPVPTGTIWVSFIPFFPGYTNTPIVGALLYQPAVSTLYSYYAIGVPGTWHLGSYSPGLAGAVCATGVPPACVPLPAMGMMTQVGTSKPGF